MHGETVKFIFIEVFVVSLSPFTQPPEQQMEHTYTYCLIQNTFPPLFTKNPKIRRHSFRVMTAWLNDPHKNFIGALVFLLKSPSNLASFLQSFGSGIASPDTTLTFEYFCSGAGFSSDIVIRRKCYSLEI